MIFLVNLFKLISSTHQDYKKIYSKKLRLHLSLDAFRKSLIIFLPLILISANFLLYREYIILISFIITLLIYGLFILYLIFKYQVIKKKLSNIQFLVFNLLSLIIGSIVIWTIGCIVMLMI